MGNIKKAKVISSERSMYIIKQEIAPNTQCIIEKKTQRIIGIKPSLCNSKKNLDIFRQLKCKKQMISLL